MSQVSSSPPRAPPIKYTAPLGTRWAKEMAAAGGNGAFDLPTDPKTIGPWILGECVGKGASGRVKIAKHRDTGQLAAVKILPVTPLVNSRTSLATKQAKSERQRLGIDKEITMMKLMNHRNIMRLYDVYENDKDLFLVLEYVEGGELFDFLVNRGRLPKHEALVYFKQIIYGLNYAHTFSIIHRDLKPENILIASLSPPLIKIADWGMAAFAPPFFQLETYCGSPHYASPEIVNGEKYQGNATDIWSCGVILYALLTGRLPFDDKNIRILLEKVKSGKYQTPDWIDPLAKNLLERMLVVDVQKRITIPEILSHPWFNNPATSSDNHNATLVMPPQLPPSPSTLARPIASRALIDPELLMSLRIIWGRHADSHGESIMRDLCSPAGEGVHAKAFYFLLGQYRDDSMRNNLSDKIARERDATGRSRANFNSGWELDSSIVNKNYTGTRSRMVSVDPAPYSRNPAAFGPVSASVAPSMRRGGSAVSGNSTSRERAPSPAGPRAPATGTRSDRKTKGPTHQGAHRVSSPAQPGSGFGRGGPRPQPPRSGYTYHQPVTKGDVSTIQFPRQPRPTDLVIDRRPKSAMDLLTSDPSKRMSTLVSAGDPSTAASDTSAAEAQVLPFVPATTIHAPTPISVSRPPLEIDTPIGPDFPNVCGPRPTTVKESNATDGREAIVHRLSAQNLAALSDTGPPHGGRWSQVAPVQARGRRVTSRRIISRIYEGEDKENHLGAESGWTTVVAEELGDRSVGLGMNRDVRRDVGNVIHLLDGVIVKGRMEKDKKSRPPTLDFRSLDQKRPTASPIALSTSVNTNSKSPLTSPVVGELKGWFSNLFNWKIFPANGQGGVLYSTDDVSKTRADIGRLLECLGVIVEGGGFNRGMSLGDCAGPLKCRAEDLSGDGGTFLNLKPVRFRVEFSFILPTPNQSLASPNKNSYFLAAPSANPYFAATPTGSSPRARTSVLINKSSHITPVSSPNMGIEFPPGCTTAVVFIHEKGSASSFRTLWRRLKEIYADGSTTFPICSPAITNTPLTEYPERLV